MRPPSPDPARARTALLAIVLLALPPLLLWPLPMVGLTEVLAAPEFEAAAHVWGLWAAWREGDALVLDTVLMGWPDGVQLPLVDPGHLLPFGIGMGAARLLGGVEVAGGFAAVVWWGLLVAGVGGALLAREVEGHPAVGAAAAMAAPAILCTPGDGLTEDLAVGWVAVQLALLLRWSRGGSPWSGIGAAVALAMAWYSGPYHGLFAAVLDVGVAAALGLRDRRALARAAAVGAAALVLCLPLAAAVLGLREGAEAVVGGGLPGSAARAGLPAVDEAAGRWRGGITTSIDLLDPWLPRQLTGAVPPVTHTGYLGIVTLGLAALGLWRQPRRWPWLLGAALFLVLALGPYVYVQGRAFAVDGLPVLAPAGWLAEALPPFGRLTRWYRAAGVAALLLVPLVALGAAGRTTNDMGARPAGRGGGNLRATLVVGGLVLDALLLAPLPWPHPHSAVPEQAAWAVLPSPAEELGAVLELPLATAGSPPEGQWRDLTALGQTLHGRPVGGTVMGLRPSRQALRARGAVSHMLQTGSLPAAEHRALFDADFRWLAVRTRYHGLPPAALEHLEACFGPPLVEATAADSDGLQIHRIPTDARGCPPAAER